MLYSVRVQHCPLFLNPFICLPVTVFLPYNLQVTQAQYLLDTATSRSDKPSGVPCEPAPVTSNPASNKTHRGQQKQFSLDNYQGYR